MEARDSNKCRRMDRAVFDSAGARLALGSIKREAGLTIRELISREVQLSTDRPCLSVSFISLQ